MNPTEKFMRDLAEYWHSGDLEGVKKLYRDDLVVTIPGRNLVSGVYRGKETWWNDYIGKVVELTGGTFEIVEVQDVIAKENRAVTMVRERFSRKGNTLEVNRLFVYDLRDGLISAIQQFEEDQYVIDEFFS